MGMPAVQAYASQKLPVQRAVLAAEHAIPVLVGYDLEVLRLLGAIIALQVPRHARRFDQELRRGLDGVEQRGVMGRLAGADSGNDRLGVGAVERGDIVGEVILERLHRPLAGDVDRGAKAMEIW